MDTYYSNYYNLRKHLYKIRYYERKEEKKRNYELYKKYDGEKVYYKQSLIDMGVLIIKK